MRRSDRHWSRARWRRKLWRRPGLKTRTSAPHSTPAPEIERDGGLTDADPARGRKDWAYRRYDVDYACRGARSCASARALHAELCWCCECGWEKGRTSDTSM
eukprot:1366741-Rhodomonas_salina.3